MTQNEIPQSGAVQPLRVWPGVVAVALLWLARYGVPLVAPAEMLPVAFMGGMVGAVLVLVWWLFLSRARWSERLLVLGLVVAAPLVARPLMHESIATAAMGMLYPMVVVPILMAALVVGAVLGRRSPSGSRTLLIGTVLVIGCGLLALVRTWGVSGGFDWEFAWRWSPSAEELMLAEGDALVGGVGSRAEEAAGAEWPGFRGPGRDGVAGATSIATDWAATPPEEIWRRPVGPGWGSFAVQGDLIYTQEQRGEEEVVSCYRADTGEPVWRHGDTVRFWEAMAGAGPRSTPTLAGGLVYAMGATGILNVLDAADGTLVWSRDVANELEATVPGWGFAGSPLVLEDSVVVALAGQLAAYRSVGGERLWTGPEGNESYGSPHLVSIDGSPQVLLLNGPSLISVAPDDGALLWQHDWSGFHSLQPAVIEGGELLIGNADSSAGIGARRLAVSRGSDGWTVEERWTSRGLKPYFNDFVIHRGHAYGFDNRILAAIDLETGERSWKGGRYGNGQLVLLPEQGLLLVLSEKGEIALVSATPDGFEELARIPALEGKTWNHPVVVGDLLLVRNAEEMAAFRLPGA